MASLSHSPLTDYPNKRICKEAISSSLYPSNNNIQDLYAFMQSLHPQMQAPPYINAKPFYYSSNVQGMSRVNGEEEPLASLTTNISSSTWGINDQASLRQHKLMEAVENKALISSSNHVAGEHHVNAAKKRIRAIMDLKDTDSKDVEANGGLKRMKSIGSGEVNVLKRELSMEVKPTNSNAQKSRGNTFNKHDNTEPKSSDVKLNGKGSASPTMNEPDSPSKPDFIHVRARRGQATDSHSLAERVRREKISERMKYLQDLVPGCVKVTGKAMMLDEIINYVQALQRQVEFLSMKLAAVHPSKLEFSLENLFGKKVVQPNNVKDGSTLGHGAAVQALAPSLDFQGNVGSGYAMRGNEMFCNSMQLHEVEASMLQTANQMPCTPAEFLANLHSDLGVDDDVLMRKTAAANSSCSLTPSATDAMLEPAYHSCISQNSQSELDWDDDLQNIVQQMGCFSQPPLFPPHLLSEGLYLQSHMKTL